MAEVIDIRNGDEQAVARAVTRAAELVTAGGLVALPDEAGYQLIASTSAPDSVDALLQFSPEADHLEPVVLGQDASSLLELARGRDAPGELTKRLANRCWPAPVVLELPRSPTGVTATDQPSWQWATDRQFLCVKVPAHEVPRGLLDLVDSPLLARPLPVTETGDLAAEATEWAAIVLQAGPSRYGGGDTRIRIEGGDW